MKAPFLLLTSFILISCDAQTNLEREVGGRCEGCEALIEYGDRTLSATDTIFGFDTNEPKIHLSGTVYQQDGKTPAEGIIIYAYHTDREGIYRTQGNETGCARRHGIHRGWVKTDKEGMYAFYTFRPASYPNTTIAQHIHLTIKEPNTIPYYIDDILFTDDPMLSESEKDRRPNRGGTGIVTPVKGSNGILKLKRDIILGKNIPGY